MTLRCLKCGASCRTRAKEPVRRPCPSCSGWLIPIGGRQILKVAQQLYRCGFNIYGAESYVYSYNPQKSGCKKSPIEAVYVQIGFTRHYDDSVFTELPEFFGNFIEQSGGRQILFSRNNVQYKKRFGDMNVASAEKALVEQLFEWAEWLYKSGMSSVLILQGKL